DKQPADADVELKLSYIDDQFRQVKEETLQVAARGGAGLTQTTAPDKAAGLAVQASSGQTSAPGLRLQATYSPSASFIHVQQTTRGDLKVGDTAKFEVKTTRETGTIYYEVVARGTVVFSDYARGRELEVALTPAMAPAARLLVYQLLPNAEVAADYVPFK